MNIIEKQLGLVTKHNKEKEEYYKSVNKNRIKNNKIKEFIVSRNLFIITFLFLLTCISFFIYSGSNHFKSFGLDTKETYDVFMFLIFILFNCINVIVVFFKEHFDIKDIKELKIHYFIIISNAIPLLAIIFNIEVFSYIYAWFSFLSVVFLIMSFAILFLKIVDIFSYLKDSKFLFLNLKKINHKTNSDHNESIIKKEKMIEGLELKIKNNRTKISSDSVLMTEVIKLKLSKIKKNEEEEKEINFIINLMKQKNKITEKEELEIFYNKSFNNSFIHND